MYRNKSDENAYVLSKYQFLATIQNEQVSLVATIRRPFENDDDHWLCAASITGLFHRKKDLEGSTAQQAIGNARQFLVEEFKHFVADGGQLLMADQTPLEKIEAVFERD